MNRTPLQFANARLRRIGPSLIIVSALIYVLALAMGQRSPLSSLFFLSPTYGQPFLDTAFWSLWVEIRFYFIYCLYLLWRNHFPKLAAAPIGLAAVAIIFQPWTGEFVNAFFITQYLPLFLLGIALHEFTKERIRKSKNWSSLVILLLVLSIESVSREAQISNQATKNQVSVVICAIVLVLVSILIWFAAHAEFGQRQSKISGKWARYLGPRTYQFYLVHLTSAGTITNILVSTYGLLYNWGGICVFVLSLILADVTYRVSESGKVKQYFTLGKTRAF